MASQLSQMKSENTKTSSCCWQDLLVLTEAEFRAAGLLPALCVVSWGHCVRLVKPSLANFHCSVGASFVCSSVAAKLGSLLL